MYKLFRCGSILGMFAETCENFEFEMLVFNLHASVLMCCLMIGISAEFLIV